MQPWKFRFNGTGLDLLIKFLVGYLLSLITLGIYASWFIVGITKYIAGKTDLEGPKGKLRLEFRGTGGQLFVLMLVNFLLTIITCGIFMPWAIVRLNKWQYANTYAIDEQGTEFNLKFSGTGGKLFGIMLGGYLLTIITLGIFAAWFMVWMLRYMAENSTVEQGGQTVTTFSFEGTGGKLLVTIIVGYLLTVITLGIYGAWFTIKLLKYTLENTKVNAPSGEHRMTFSGTGGQLFVILIVGWLLTMITLCIYMP